MADVNIINKWARNLADPQVPRYLGNWPSTAQANNWAAQVAVTRSVDGKQPIPVNAGFLPAPPPPPLLPSVFHEIYGSGARDGRGGAPPMSPPMSPEAAMAYAAGAPPGAAGGPPLGFQPQMQPQMQPQPQYQQQQPQQPHAQQHWPDNCIQAVQQCSPFRRHRRRSRGPDGQPLPFEDPAAYGVYDPAASPVQGPGPGQAYASSPQSTQGSFTTQDQFYYQQPAGGQQQPYPYPQQPGAPGDPVAALLSTVSRTNELLRKESMARTYGLRHLLDFIYDNLDVFGEAMHMVKGGAAKGSFGVLRGGGGAAGLDLSRPWLRPPPRGMSIPDSSRVLEPETDVRLAYLNLEGVQFAPSSSNSTSGPAGAGPIGSQGSPSREAMGTSPEAAAEALYGVALTLWLAHPDVVALSGLTDRDAPRKLAVLLNTWASPRDGEWRQGTSGNLAVPRTVPGQYEGTQERVRAAPMYSAFLWRERPEVMPYKRDLDGQAFGVLYGLQDAASGAVSTLSHSPFFGTFLLNGRPVMLLNAHLGVAPGADPGAVLRQVAILPALAKAGASPQDPELQQALWLCVVGGFNMPPGRVDREGRPADEEAAAWERMGRAGFIPLVPQDMPTTIPAASSQQQQQHQHAPDQGFHLDGIWLLQEPFLVGEGLRPSRAVQPLARRAGAFPTQHLPDPRLCGSHKLVFAELKVVPPSQSQPLSSWPDLRPARLPPPRAQPGSAVGGSGYAGREGVGGYGSPTPGSPRYGAAGSGSGALGGSSYPARTGPTGTYAEVVTGRSSGGGGLAGGSRPVSGSSTSGYGTNSTLPALSGSRPAASTSTGLAGERSSSPSPMRVGTGAGIGASTSSTTGSGLTGARAGSPSVGAGAVRSTTGSTLLTRPGSPSSVVGTTGTRVGAVGGTTTGSGILKTSAGSTVRF